MAKVGTATSTNGAYDPTSNDPEAVKAWDEAKNQAKDAGIQWERPAGDTRSAEEIINDTPLLRDLGNQENVREMLEDRVGGDIETDADAAFRATQVLEHIEKLDENGNRIIGGDIDNGRVDGFSKGGDAYHGTEAGRLKDFGEQGFGFLKGELKHVATASEDPEAKKQAEELGIRWERPEGDDRSAKDIIDNDPLLKNLGNQSHVKDMLKERVGDYENDADAAYRASQVLGHIEQLDGDGNKIVGGDRGNSSIDGFTNSGEARNGTEAGRLQDFGKYGFSNLKGKMDNPDNVGGDKDAREAAEKAGIKWELPEDDKRSASDIIDDNPALKNLGNQSGVKDMLKEKVGDYEKDADAAYRAAQVIDRITLYNEKGETQSGGDVSNTSIDGFTSSSEARNGTEAGRLQDFGKYGFSNLPSVKKTEDIGSYKDFLDKNKDADETSKTFAKYGALIDENFDLIKGKTGVDGEVTRESLERFKNENPQISDDLKEALNFWSKPGAFEKLETASNPLKGGPDGKLSKDDVTSWIKDQSPKDASSAIEFLSGAANDSTVSGVDTSKLNKDIFDNPDKHSTEEKAAALQDLLKAQGLIGKGMEAGMWGDDYSVVSVSNRAGTNPKPEEVLKEIGEKINILQSDPEVVKYMNENSAKQFDALLKDNPGLKDSLQKTYDDNIKSGKEVNRLWDANTKDGKTDQSAVLGSFMSTAQLYQGILGIKSSDQPNSSAANPDESSASSALVGDIQDAVAKSDHIKDFESYYENELASGKRLDSLMTENDNDYEKAAAAFSLEAGIFGTALKSEFTDKFDKDLEKKFTDFTTQHAGDTVTFDDMKKAYGVNGGDELDEKKVLAMLENTEKENPEFFLKTNGEVLKPEQALQTFRAEWDLMRNGQKMTGEILKDNVAIAQEIDAKAKAGQSPLTPAAAAEKLKIEEETLKKWKGDGLGQSYDRGALHVVSGLILGGMTIARGAGGGGDLTEKQRFDIATGAIQTATIMTEGGAKMYAGNTKDIAALSKDSRFVNNQFSNNWQAKIQKYSDNNNAFQKVLEGRAKTVENSAKIGGGITGIIGGAYSIFDGVKSLRNGDKLSAGFSITSGAVGIMAGATAGIEGAANLLGVGTRALTALAFTSGALGILSAGVGILAMIPGLIKEGEQQAKADSFGDLLGSYLRKYEIDGIPNGDIYDLPADAFPGEDSGIAS